MVKRKKNSLCCSCSSLLNSSPYLSLVCMVSIMATILVLSSSGKEFNSCGSIFILVMCLCASCVSGVKKCRRLKKRLIFVFFRSLVFLCKAKKRQKISVETRNMLPLPTTTTTHHHHHYHHRDHHHLGEEGHHQQSTSDSEEMAFMASQLLDGNT